jgi:hypothetical protein
MTDDDSDKIVDKWSSAVMKRNKLLFEGVVLILAGGLLLFGANRLSPERLVFPIVTFIGGLVGYLIFDRVSIWRIDNRTFRDLVMFSITILTSSFAVLCLLITCNAFSKLSICIENKRNAIIILNFSFPLLMVFFGWLSSLWPRTR